MSAEPAAKPADDPARSYVNAATGGDVIHIDRRRRHGAGRTGRERRHAMDAPGPPANPGKDRSPLAGWAESIELSFKQDKQSLTVPATAAAYLRTVDIFERTLEGCHAQGVISADELEQLLVILEGMRKVPKLVESAT